MVALMVTNRRITPLAASLGLGTELIAVVALVVTNLFIHASYSSRKVPFLEDVGLVKDKNAGLGETRV